MPKKVATKPSAPPVPTINEPAPKSPNQLLQEFLNANNLELNIKPSSSMKVVSDGSVILAPPQITVNHRNGS